MKRGIMDKPKFEWLCDELGWGPAYARGVLDCLFEIVGRECPRGDVGSMTDREIASAMKLEPDDRRRIGEVIEKMIETGWLAPHDEHRLVLVDWADECPNFVRQQLKRRGLTPDDLVEDFMRRI